MSSQPPSQPAAKPMTPQEKMRQARNAQRQQYYSEKTPEEAMASARVYQEKQAIKKQIEEENKKVEVNTALVMQKIDSKSKKEDQEYVHKLKLQTQLAKDGRIDEEKHRLAKLEQIRENKRIIEERERKALEERRAAIQSGTYSRDASNKSGSDDESKGNALGGYTAKPVNTTTVNNSSYQTFEDNE